MRLHTVYNVIKKKLTAPFRRIFTLCHFSLSISLNYSPEQLHTHTAKHRTRSPLQIWRTHSHAHIRQHIFISYNHFVLNAAISRELYDSFDVQAKRDVLHRTAIKFHFISHTQRHTRPSSEVLIQREKKKLRISFWIQNAENPLSSIFRTSISKLTSLASLLCILWILLNSFWVVGNQNKTFSEFRRACVACRDSRRVRFEIYCVELVGHLLFFFCSLVCAKIGRISADGVKLMEMVWYAIGPLVLKLEIIPGLFTLYGTKIKTNPLEFRLTEIHDFSPKNWKFFSMKFSGLCDYACVAVAKWLT